jgi:hypothetical protein
VTARFLYRLLRASKDSQNFSAGPAVLKHQQYDRRNESFGTGGLPPAIVNALKSPTEDVRIGGSTTIMAAK